MSPVSLFGSFPDHVEQCLRDGQRSAQFVGGVGCESGSIHGFLPQERCLVLWCWIHRHGINR
jgi:hypothetical protein